MVAIIAASVLSLAPVAAQAATAGNGDVSNAMRYGVSAPLGNVIAGINGDDTSETIASSFPVNFFGTKYEGLCISDNGTVSPVLTSSDTCSNSYNLSVAELARDSESPMIAVLASDLHPGSDNCAALQAATTFGTACTVYGGSTTIDGRDAMVFTWYRIPMYANANTPGTFATFQMILIKRDTPNGATLGYNFDFEFNYATVSDIEDGYSYADPTTNCDYAAQISDCRWGVGPANYSTPGVVGGVATGYEFFNEFEISRLADSGNFALIANSLNSDIPGRYTCAMMDGIAVDCNALTAGLAETGADNGQLALFGGLAALSLVAGAAVVVRRRKA
jgi:LPXTG-motif cell wall-anchored protein